MSSNEWVESVAAELRAAENAVRQADLSEDFANHAFEFALRRLPGSAAREVASEGTGGPSPASAAANDAVGRVAGYFNLSAAVVADLYEFTGDDMHLLVGASRLDPTKKGGTVEVAQLVLAGRQGSGLDEWTSVNEVRRWAMEMNRYDESNFSAHVRSLDALVSLKGSGQRRLLRLKAGQRDVIRQLLLRLAGAD